MIGRIPEGKTRLILVEGKDEIQFFKRFACHLQKNAVSLPSYIKCEILEYEGKSKLASFLLQIMSQPSFKQVTHIGIVRDSDFNTDAFSSICSALKTANGQSGKSTLPIPQAILLPTTKKPIVTALTIPLEREGALESILIEVFGGDPIMSCVDDYFTCIQAVPNSSILEHRLDKQRLHAFIAGKKVDGNQSTPDDVKRNLLRNIYSMTWLPDKFWDHDAFLDARKFLELLAH